MDVEGCHRLALSNAYKTQNPAQDKGFIVKSVNIKYSECLLQLKSLVLEIIATSISVKNLLLLYLFAHITNRDFFWVNVPNLQLDLLKSDILYYFEPFVLALWTVFVDISAFCIPSS